ncbi:MAG: Exopolyphosphatase [uncultured Acetobacteraceae bacterium]|uniref:Exopolyphosphatase n=1 Tax=uncultured Acetobacteraceae bacterium TaxID=169975 RepID=A0A6J4JC57_9PROT|nr:MAG: Exopolyphosphatase [uncultured Acetobacteraceae bacterium]
MPDDAAHATLPSAAGFPVVADQDARALRSGGPSLTPAYAALDLGTNNCRLLVAAPSLGGFRVVDSFSRIVRLGEGLAASGRLSESAMDRAVSALAACAEKLARRPVRGFHAVATEACRRATNGSAFLSRVEAETGLRPRIISAREEAELAMESCAPLLEGGDRRALLFDIGGGSTEIAWIRVPPPRGGGGALGGPAAGRHPTAELIGYVSLPFGVVTLAERVGASCFTEQGFGEVVELVAEHLRRFDRVHCIGQEIRAGGVRLIGTSGTVTTLAGVALALPRYRRPLVDGRTLEAGVADQAMGDLFALGRDGLAAHPCVGPERVEFVLPGCAVYAAIRQVWQVPSLTVADRGLREGMLLRMIRADAPRGGRTPVRDPRAHHHRPVPPRADRLDP